MEAVPCTLEQMEAARQQLFKDVMSGKWNTVEDTYKRHAFAREAKITRAEDTVLHVAVSEGDKQVVQRLVDATPDAEASLILGAKNESGDTPLHLAAALGLVDVCVILASRSPPVIVRARNRNGETPLFVAANHGKKVVFFALQSKIHASPQFSQLDTLSFCRRNDGDTILHAAVYGEYFDLAFEIIHLYPHFVNYNNERGQTALHLLANKPFVFRSGSRIRRLDSLIYSCLIVDPLKVKYEQGRIYSNGIQLEARSMRVPENYKTCLDLFGMLGQAFHLMAASLQGWHRKNYHTAGDQVDPRSSLQKNMAKDVEVARQSDDASQSQVERAYEAKSRFPENYVTCFNFFKITMKILLVFLGIGIWRIEKIKRKKQKHTHAYQLMDELVNRASHWGYEADGRKPYKTFKGDDPGAPPNEDDIKKMIPDAELVSSQEKKGALNEPSGDTPMLVAAKTGVKEMVKKILDTFPVAVQDMDSNHRNIVLLAVEYRQPHVYQYMLQRKKMKESIFGRVDREGNSALHLAATMGRSRPWIIPGAALQMQWEIKWYKFVKNSMEPGFFQHYNNEGQTAREIFTIKHESLVKDGGGWLTNTSQSCSVVAALIATVAFASATAVPGGVKADTGLPTLEGQPAFDVFAIAALVALCFSVTSLVMFLAILTSRYQEMDFENDLPVKLILGLTSLFMSIAAMLVSFCAGHFFVIEKQLKYAAYPIYGITCLPITFFAVAQFPLYIDLVKATIAHVPERTYKIRTF